MNKSIEVFTPLSRVNVLVLQKEVSEHNWEYVQINRDGRVVIRDARRPIYNTTIQKRKKLKPCSVRAFYSKANREMPDSLREWLK